MSCRQESFSEGQDENQSPSYQGGSLASRTALLESVKRLVMSVTSGRTSGVSLARLSPDGLWLKMYGDYFQAKMDDSFEKYSEILPAWGLMLDGQLFQPPPSEQYTDESGWRLLPSPRARDWKGQTQRGKHAPRDSICNALGITGGQINPEYIEQFMGFPTGWTE